MITASVLALAHGAELWAFAFADANEVEIFVLVSATEGGALTLTDGAEVDPFDFSACTELKALVFAVGAEDSKSNVVVDTVLYSPDLKDK